MSSTPTSEDLSGRTAWIDVLRVEIGNLKAQIDELRGRLNNVRSIQIENCGRDGRNGRNAELRRDCDAMDNAIKHNQRAIEKLLRANEQQGARLTMLVSVSAAIATMVGGAVIRYIWG
jgi:prefoldin subunit 5